MIDPEKFAVVQDGSRFVVVEFSAPVSPEDRATFARLVASAADHTLIARAMCIGVGRWEPWGDGRIDRRGEFVINGMRYATRLDDLNVPALTPALRVVLREAVRP